MLCESQSTEAKPGKKASSFAQATEDNLQTLFAWLANRSLSEGARTLEYLAQHMNLIGYRKLMFQTCPQSCPLTSPVSIA